jgi:putative ABC transport system permease protein
VWSLIKIALTALGRNSLRTALTTLGIAVGIAAVIGTVALGEGSAAQVHKDLVNLGDNFVWLENGSLNVGGARTGSGGASKLTLDDMRAVLDEIPEIARCSPQVDSRSQIVYGNQNWNTMFRGVSPEFMQIRSWPVEDGTAFTDHDVETFARVVLLGSSVAAVLSPEGHDAIIGQQIRVGRVPFTVLGVLKAKGQSSVGQDQDDFIVIPYSTVMRTLKRQVFLDDILCSARSSADIPAAQGKMAALMRDRHRIMDGKADDFNIRAPDEAIKVREETTRSLGLMISSVAFVSLIVGGVGIMNIMLVSVTERTREIGLRMAIGARESDVQRQFLLEALVLGLLGGAVGVLLGVAGSRFLTDSLGWPMEISWRTIAVAVAFSSAVGLVFGYYPARRAAQLDPIEALRVE